MLRTLLAYLAVFLAATSGCRADEDLSNFTDTYSMALHGTGLIIDSSEICPPGNELIDGICTCNQDLCETPPCDGILNIVRNGSDNPTSCCAVYACDNCSADSNGTSCLCGEEAFLNDRGDCECIDPHKSFVDGVCTCDIEKCELPALCDSNSLPFREKVGCCYKTTCRACPEDTYPTNYTSDEIENKCVCYPCPEKRCNETHVPQVIRPGTNLPYECCDLYNCVAIGSTCTMNQITYKDTESWLTHDKQLCTCAKGVTLCDKPAIPTVPKHCISNEAAYPHLATWAEDACTNCTCYNGTAKCIAHMCNVSETTVPKKYNDCLYYEESYEHLQNWQTRDCFNCTCYDGLLNCEPYACDKKPNCPPLDKCKRFCKYGFKNRRGCDICKCKLPDKAVEVSSLDIYMKDNNLSETDVLDMIKRGDTEKQPKEWHIIVSIATGIFVGVIIVLLYHWFAYKKKYCNRYSPVMKHAENNNISMMEGDIKYISEKKPLKK